MNKDIVILSVPRIAPVRPSAGVAMIKTLCNSVNKSNIIIDINKIFFTEFTNQFTQEAKAIDEYFVQYNKELSVDVKTIYNNWIKQCIQDVLAYSPRLIAISVFSWQSQKFVTDFLLQLRKKFTGEIIIGGQGLVNSQNMSSHWTKNTDYAEDLLNKKMIDYYMKGEVEKTFPRFLKGERKLPGLNNNQHSILENIDDAPYMDFSDFSVDNYQNGYDTGVLPIESSRGCVRSCSFCEMSSEHGKHRSKDGDKLAKEIIYYYESTGCRNFYFHDDLINGNLKDFKKFINQILDYYKENNLNDRHFTLSGYWIVRSEKQFNEQDFEKFYRAGGNTLVTGVETGSDRLRKVMKKGFTNKDLEFTLKCINQFKMKFYFMLIAGLPGETEEDFNETIALLSKLQKYVATGNIIGINLGTTATIEPGTDIFKNYKKYNLVGLAEEQPKGIYWMCTTTPELDYRERVRRRVKLQEYVMSLGYPLWKGDDHLRIIIDKYKENVEVWNA